MLLSMTGFGRAILEYKNKKIVVDVRSLNSKTLDINTKIPAYYKEKELDIRRLISQELQRGKIDFLINVEANSNDVAEQLNADLIAAYYERLQKISIEKSIPLGNEILSSIIRFPDVFKNNNEELNDEEWQLVMKTIDESLRNCLKFRADEGKMLKEDILQKVNNILQLLFQISQYESERITIIKDRLKQHIDDIRVDVELDSNRYEQEIIYYMEKLDINEEKVRLKKHCEYFIETIEQESSGKKLGFISQEMGREINTLGSKAHHVEIQKNVVMMKDELEKIKEQLLNVL